MPCRGLAGAIRRFGALIVASAFVCGVAVTPAVIAADSTTDVANLAPVILDVSLPLETYSPTAGSTTSITTTVSVSDENGCADLEWVNVTVLAPDDTTHVAWSQATKDSCTLTSGTWTHTFEMRYHDDPALGTDHYKIKVRATDSQGASDETLLGNLTRFNYEELAALNLGSSTLDFGADLAPGASSATQSLSVENFGNVQIDAQLNGTNLTHATEPATIHVDELAYSHNSDMSDGDSLTLDPVTNTTFDLAAGSGAAKTLYWQLTVPSGSDQWIPSGTYTGEVTITAVKG